MKSKLLTSLNVDMFVISEIRNFSEKYGFKKEEIAKILIKKVITNFNSGKVVGSLTEYQNHKPDKWFKMDYSLSLQENELFSSTRQKYKISISKMLFIGFMLFWKELIYYYKERLKNIKISTNSYDKFYQKHIIFIKYFKKRLNIIKKE